MSGTRESCTCAWCREGCDLKPGWFAPGEAEKAADLLGMSMRDFFQAHLAVDWWEVYGGRDIFVLSPAIEDGEPGSEFPGNPRGRCVFYQEGRCQVHDAKPVECRARWHGDKDGSPGLHEEVAMAWKDHQGQVAELLGREPESESWGGLAALFGGLGL